MPFIEVSEIAEVKAIVKDAIEKILAQTNIKVLIQVHDENNIRIIRKAALKMGICKTYKVAWNVVLGDTKEKQIVRARHAYIFIAVMYLKQSYDETALDVGKFKHSNVSATVKKINGFMKVNDNEADVIRNIVKDLKL